MRENNEDVPYEEKEKKLWIYSRLCHHKKKMKENIFSSVVMSSNTVGNIKTMSQQIGAESENVEISADKWLKSELQLL